MRAGVVVVVVVAAVVVEVADVDGAGLLSGGNASPEQATIARANAVRAISMRWDISNTVSYADDRTLGRSVLLADVVNFG